ncbi:MAG: hypothetical protein ACI9ZX_002973, partial [Algoriphagus sp.]
SRISFGQINSADWLVDQKIRPAEILEISSNEIQTQNILV